MRLTVYQVANRLEISPQTINNWYAWYRDSRYKKPEDVPQLPDYEQHGKGTRYWQEDDLWMLLEFRAWIKHGRDGVMSEYSRTRWGKKYKKPESL